METLFYRMITNGLIVLALLPAVWFLCRAFRKQPATQNLLWLLLLAKLTLAPLLIWSFSFESESELIDFLARKEPEVVASADAMPATQPTTNVNPKAAGEVTVDSPQVVTIQPEPADNSISESIEPQITAEPLIEEADAQPLTQFPSESLANNEPTPADAPIASDPAIPEPEQAKIAATPAISPVALETSPQKASSPPLLTSILKIIRSSEVIWGGSMIWLAGCLAFGLNAARKLRATRNLIKNSLPCSIELAQIAQEVAENFRIKRIEVREVAGLDSPCVVAFWRAKILWPSEMNPTAQGCRAIMAHEIVHIKRRDHWAMWLEMVAGVMWWWNPACYFIRRRLHETRELACDAVAISQLGEEPSDYAQKLIDLTTGQSFRASRHLPACSVGAVSKNSLQRRLVMLFEDRIVGRTSRMGLLAGLLITGLVLPTFVLGEPKESEKKETPTVAEKSSPAIPTDKDAVEKVVTEMMDALRDGDRKKAESLLTPTAIESTQKAGMPINVPGNPKFRFKILDTNILPLEKGKQGAHVTCECIDVGPDGKERNYPFLWALRYTKQDWRIAGIGFKTMPDQSVTLVDLEDAEGMKAKSNEISNRYLYGEHSTTQPDTDLNAAANQSGSNSVKQDVKATASKPNTIQPFDSLKLECDFGTDNLKPLRVYANGRVFFSVQFDRRVGSQLEPHIETFCIKVSDLTIEEAEKTVQEALLSRKTIKELNYRIPVQISEIQHSSDSTHRFENQKKIIINPGDRLKIENSSGKPHGTFTVEEAGTIALGARFGRVKVAGLTMVEAMQAITEHLRKFWRETEPTFNLWMIEIANPGATHNVNGKTLMSSFERAEEQSKATLENDAKVSAEPPPRRSESAASADTKTSPQNPGSAALPIYEVKIKHYSLDPKDAKENKTPQVLEAPSIRITHGIEFVFETGGEAPIFSALHEGNRSIFRRSIGTKISGTILKVTKGKAALRFILSETKRAEPPNESLVTSEVERGLTVELGKPSALILPANQKGTHNWVDITVTELPADASLKSSTQSTSATKPVTVAQKPAPEMKDFTAPISLTAPAGGNYSQGQIFEVKFKHVVEEKGTKEKVVDGPTIRVVEGREFTWQTGGEVPYLSPQTTGSLEVAYKAVGIKITGQIVSIPKGRVQFLTTFSDTQQEITPPSVKEKIEKTVSDLVSQTASEPDSGVFLTRSVQKSFQAKLDEEFKLVLPSSETKKEWIMVTISDVTADERAKAPTGSPTSSVATRANVNPSDLIQPGDKLYIKCDGIPKDGSPEGGFVVEPSGMIALGPMYGRAKIQGLTIEEAERAITLTLKKFYKEPLVQITMDFNARKTRELMIDGAKTNVDYAKRAVEAARVKLDKLTEANKTSPGAVSVLEIEEAKLSADRSIFELRRAMIESELVKMGTNLTSSDRIRLHTQLTDVQQTLDQTLEVLQVELEAAKVKESASEKKLERTQILLNRNVISAGDFESAKAEHELIKVEVKRAEARIEAAKRLANEKGSPTLTAPGRQGGPAR